MKCAGIVHACVSVRPCVGVCVHACVHVCIHVHVCVCINEKSLLRHNKKVAVAT